MKKILLLSLVCIALMIATVGCGKITCGDSHNVVVDEAVAADCNNSGLTRGEHCADCGLVIVEQKTVPPAHDYEDILEGGKIYLRCKKCSGRLSEKFSAGLEIEVNEENKTCVIKGVGECKDKEINIPPVISGYTVEGVAKRAFSGERKLNSIKVPEGVLSIGDYAFAGCTRLTSIDLPDSITSLGMRIFYECGSLKSIEIPEGATSIGTGTFFYCGSLKSIVIPKGVKKIGMQCFASTGIKKVFYMGNKEEWSSISFDYGNGTLTSANIFFYSKEKPQDVGNYWHYVDGVAKIWR